MPHKEYRIRRNTAMFDPPGDWNSPAWKNVTPLTLEYFRPESSSHHPFVQAKAVYDTHRVSAIFRVEDNYVRCIRTGYQVPVCKDSCVEFFIRPNSDKGYFNFEVNCGGAMLVSYITDPTRAPGGPLKESCALKIDECEKVKIFHSMPSLTEPELQTPIVWTVELHIPFSLFETYIGALGNPAGQHWRANFYKCADESSHPHWAAWSPVDQLNFHLPDQFGTIIFS